MERELDLVLSPQEAASPECIARRAACSVGLKREDLQQVRILRRSIDARREPVFRLRLFVSTEKPIEKPCADKYGDVSKRPTVIVAGAGPCGLFAALKLIEFGLRPLIVERGKCVEERKKDVALIARNVSLDENSNWCFGEGGAGTFSDGKLYTRSNKRGNINEVLQTFVAFGASESILYDAHAHIGTDKLSRIIKNIRKKIISCGGEYCFNAKVVDFQLKEGKVNGVVLEDGSVLEGRAVILATGHSARDIYELFFRRSWLIESKPFAMGVRVEHSQQMINRRQYRTKHLSPYLPAASYTLTHNIGSRGVFSFCMCPGGMIVPSSTEPGALVVNGMSSSRRSSPFANSGIVVSVSEKDASEYADCGALSLMRLQQECEKKMYLNCQIAPAQRISDFVAGRTSRSLCASSYPSGLECADMNALLPKFVAQSLKEGFKVFERKIRGFVSSDALMIGLESRTSSPVRIPRDRMTMQHPDLPNLYPCGEGAGYAGGITSSAIDGINAAGLIAASEE